MSEEKEMRKCSRCANVKPIDEFYTFKRAAGYSYTRPDCKICFNRMSHRNKDKRKTEILLKGKPGKVLKRKAAYQYNREQILRNARKKAKIIPKKVKSALIEGELADLLEKQKKEDNGTDKDKKPKTKRKRRSPRKLRSGTDGQKGSDS